MHDYLEFERKHRAKIDAFCNYWALDFKNLFGGEMWIGRRWSGVLTIIGAEATSIKEDGE